MLKNRSNNKSLSHQKETVQYSVDVVFEHSFLIITNKKNPLPSDFKKLKGNESVKAGFIK